MERRDFLKLTVGFVTGAAALASRAQAAPLPPIAAAQARIPSGEGAEPAVVSQQEVDRLKPEEVHWGHHRHWHRHRWHRRHWGWRRRRW